MESGVEFLMDDLVEQICDLMVEYVKGLRDDFVGFNFWSEIYERGMTDKRGERKESLKLTPLLTPFRTNKFGLQFFFYFGWATNWAQSLNRACGARRGQV